MQAVSIRPPNVSSVLDGAVSVLDAGRHRLSEVDLGDASRSLQDATDSLGDASRSAMDSVRSAARAALSDRRRSRRRTGRWVRTAVVVVGLSVLSWVLFAEPVRRWTASARTRLVASAEAVPPTGEPITDGERPATDGEQPATGDHRPARADGAAGEAAQR